MPDSLAVEVDTFADSFGNNQEDSGNHIAVHTRGTDSNSPDSDGEIATTDISIPEDFIDGNEHQLTVRYRTPRGSANTLTVKLDGRTVLTTDLDLGQRLNLPISRGVVGFVAGTGVSWATGTAAARHEIASWQFEASE